MVIGNGDIASVLPESKFLFFASGVSDSQETRHEEYQREIDLLLRQPRNAHIVYFSSLAIFYADNIYTQHKLQVERILKNNFKKYTIIRLGNITWGKNPHTLINFLRNQRKEGIPLLIKDEFRYITDKEEFLHWISLIPNWNCEINITGKRMKVREVAREYC